jgi:hypothetical protein
MALENLLFNSSGLALNPFFNTTNITNCSGPPYTGATLTAAVSEMLSSAQSHARSISMELICISRNIQSYSIFQKLVQKNTNLKKKKVIIQLVKANSSAIKCTTYQELIWQDSNVKASFPVFDKAFSSSLSSTN